MEGWEPATLDELRQALADRVLEEGQHVQFKVEVAAGTSASKEWAREVVAMAVLGGRFYMGVAEPDGTPPAVEPVPLAGLPERLVQIAATRTSPPLTITTRTLTEEGGATGVVIVGVALSPLAPHMVGDRYWRRVDRTKAVLSDVEVRDLMEARRAASALV